MDSIGKRAVPLFMRRHYGRIPNYYFMRPARFDADNLDAYLDGEE